MGVFKNFPSYYTDYYWLCINAFKKEIVSDVIIRKYSQFAQK